MKKLSKEILIQLYVVEGLTHAQIAERYGVARRTVGNWLASYGIEARRQEYTEISKETLEQLYYEEGLTQRQIAERLGTNEDTVRNRMKAYGLKTRGGYVEIPREELERLWTSLGMMDTNISPDKVWAGGTS